MEEELNDGSLLSKKEEGLAVEGTMRRSLIPQL